MQSGFDIKYTEYETELKLLKGLEIGCSGIITATCNVTAAISRKVYDDYKSNKLQTANEMLCNVRNVFDQFNLIFVKQRYKVKP